MIPNSNRFEMSSRLPLSLAALGWLLLLSSFGARAQDSVQWTTNYYSVPGATVPEIRESIHRNRPWKERFQHDARTEWEVKWNFTVEPTASGCRCRYFHTQTTIAVYLPRWVGPTNTADRVKQTWREYAAALSRHEAGHAETALAAVAELHKRVPALPESPTCEGSKKQTGDLCQSILEEHRKRDLAYDEKTNHGMTQGAFLPDLGPRHR